MFYDAEIKVLNKDLAESKTIYGDFQVYDKVIKFEDGIELEIRHRVFCDIEATINNEGYLLIEEVIYKIIDIKKWSDYLEIYIYECSG